MATATDAYAASRATFEIVYTDLLGFLRQLDDACVRWVPPAPETNSISGMVRHMLGATARWLARATGDKLPPANREAELHATDSVAELIATTERSLEELRRSFERLQQVDPAELRRFTQITRPGEFEESVAWCVEHALLHAGEHWGQMQLTGQWYAASAQPP
jgi:uncharacterized damage-inducible protein DinB